MQNGFMSIGFQDQALETQMRLLLIPIELESDPKVSSSDHDRFSVVTLITACRTSLGFRSDLKADQ